MIFYLSAGNELMAAPIAVEGPRLDVGTARKLFDLRSVRALQAVFARGPFDVSPDGQRFLVCAAERDPEPAPITIVTHWTSLLE